MAELFTKEFLDDCFYAPEAMFLDAIERIDREKSEITCRLPTDQTFPLTTAQRGSEKAHPKHVAGGILVHVTGMLGWAHAYHLLGLRHKDGWVGYGTHIHSATFRKLAVLGPPVSCWTRQKKARKISGKIFSTYEIKYEQNGEEVFASEQSAIWLQP